MRGTLNSEDVLESRITMARLYLVLMGHILRTALCMPALEFTEAKVRTGKKLLI